MGGGNDGPRILDDGRRQAVACPGGVGDVGPLQACGEITGAEGVARRRGVDHLFGGQPQGGDFDPLRCRDHQARLRAALDDDLAHPEALAPWLHCERNPYWRKLHEHIDDKAISSWCDDHDQILKALMRKDPQAAKLAMWQHLENTNQMLFQATIFDDEMEDDRYLFSENPVVHLTQPSTANG